jgi:hypothetical protein
MLAYYVAMGVFLVTSEQGVFLSKERKYPLVPFLGEYPSITED